MKKKNQRIAWVFALALGCGMGATAQASLVGVLPITPGGSDYQAYYDSSADLTWLADANANGPMQWNAANQWANDLDVRGVSGWRLPDTPQPDSSCSDQFSGASYGTGCTGSDMGHLFYDVLGGVAERSIDDVNNANYAKFSHIVPDYYWSASPLADDESSAWIFDFGTGYQDLNSKSASLNAWAVHSGNVANNGAAQVPAPSGLWLVAAVLIGLLTWRRRATRERLAA